MTKEINGKGSSVPPTKEHVLIYFSQKDAPKSAAVAFYDYFHARNWNSKRNRKMINWKCMAWIWILNLT
jgi:hypothetical protein